LIGLTHYEFFVNVAKDIGKDSCAVNQEHQSCRNLFPVCQTTGLADVDNVSDLSNICHLSLLSLDLILLYLLKSIFFLNIACLSSWFMYGAGCCVLLHFFKEGADPTLINVILTNRKSLLQNVMNFSCGLSDVHNLIAVQIKSNTPSLKNPYKTCYIC
jgi:hypothetical protein